MTISNHEMQYSNGEAARSKAREGARLSRIALIVALFLGLALAAVLAVELFVVDRLPLLTLDQLTAAEELWEAKGPASYDVDIMIEGAQPGVVHVEVRDGITTAMQRDGLAPSQRRTWDYWTVPGMFDTIEREFDIEADPEHEMDATANTSIQLRSEFDKQYGYPTRFHRIVFGGGTEVFWKVTNFEVK